MYQPVEGHEIKVCLEV